MSLDSTAELLFKINADSADAESNIARFRTLMGKDLESVGAEFDDWASKVLGDLSTVQGAMTAGGAVMAAGLVAAGVAAVHAADAYVGYVTEISNASKVTGIAVEDMSALHFATHETGGNFEALTHGVTKFEAEVVKANQTDEGRIKLARELGVTQQQIAAGEKNILPLIGAASDRYRSLAGDAERAAFAREHFGKGFAGMVGDLALGADGFKKLSEEAKRAGQIIRKDDVDAVKEYKASSDALIAIQQQLDIEWGSHSLPLMEAMKLSWTALVKTITDAMHGNFDEDWVTNYGILKNRVLEMRKLLAGGEQGKPKPDDGILPPPEKVAKVRQEFSGLADILETVKERMANSVGG
jgi:hypothetical protein